MLLIRFLNSGGFIGYAKDIYELVTAEELKDTDDDQRYYTKLFLEERDKRGIKLDTKTKIFANLNHAICKLHLAVSGIASPSSRFNHFAANFELRFVESEAQLHNVDLGTRPLIIHGNGPSKRHLNHLGNYLPRAWNEVDQCTSCWEDVVDFEALPEVPRVVMAVFVSRPTPFLDEFFELLLGLEYPKDKVQVHSNLQLSIHISLFTYFLS